MGNKYLKAGTLYMLGNVFDKALAFFTVPIFTKLLSTSDYGIATTYLSWVSLLTVVITLSVGNSIRTAVVDFNKDINGYLSSVFTLGTISTLAISAIILLLNIVFNVCNSGWLILCCCLQSFSVSILRAIDWKYVMEVKYIKRTLLQCIPNLLTIGLSIVLILYRNEDKYLGKIYAYVIVFTVVALPLMVHQFIKGKCFINKKYWLYALSFSLPIIFHSLSNVVLSQSDRIMITNYRDPSETGLYGLAYQFGLVPLVITTTLENLWIPWFTGKMQNSDYSSIHRFVPHYILIVVIGCSLYMLVSPELLKLMTDSSYHAAVNMIAPIVLAVFFLFIISIPLDMEYYYKKTGTIATNTLMAAGSNVILNIFFIPKYGAIAAAYTTVASYALSFVMHYFAGKRIDNKFVSYRYYIPGFVILLFVTLFVHVFIDSWITRWGIAVMACVISVPYILKKMTIFRSQI